MNKFQRFLAEKLFGISAPGKAAPIRQGNQFLPFTPQATFGTGEPAPFDQHEQIKAGRASWAYTCIKKIAPEIANIQLRLYKKTAQGNVEVPIHEAINVLDKANSFMTRYDLFELLAIFLESAGEAFWWKMKSDKEKTISIYPWLNPCYMKVVPDPETFIGKYVYYVPGTAKTIEFEPNQIIHFKYPDPINAYRGLSPIKAAEYAIASDREAARWNWRFFRNAARPFGLVLLDGTLTDAQYKRIKTQMEIGMKGEENAHKMAILEKARDFKEVGFNQKDMDFLNQRGFSRDEIFSIFQVPKSIATFSAGSRAEAETQKAIFIENTIVPKLRKIVSYLNEFYLPDFDTTEQLFFDFDNPAPKDIELSLKYYDSAIKSGWMSPNEVRAEEGFDPFIGGNDIRLPINLVPIGSIATGKMKSVKTNIKIWRETLGEKIDKVKEGISANVKEKMQKIVKKQVVKSKEKITDEFREQQAIYIVKRADAEEDNFRKKINAQFARQEKEVVGSIREKEIKNVDVVFEVEKEKGIFVKVFTPEILDIIERHGQEAFDLVDVDGEFQTHRETISQFLKTRGVKFAKEVNETTKANILEAIKVGVEAGEGISEIKTRISEVFAEATEVRSVMIARTEVSRVSNFATIEGYRQSGVVEQKEWLTAIDERTCAYCMSLNGKKINLSANFFDMGDTLNPADADRPMEFNYEKIEAPPLHVNCRCTTIPVLSKSMLPIAKKEEKKIDIDKIKDQIKKEVAEEVLEETIKTIKEANNE